jgi:nitroreductase
MDALEAIMTRRSIRSYEDRPVSEEDLETLLRAAMAAPSARNEQPWHFVVARDPAVKDRIPDYHPYAACVLKAPLAVLVCADLEQESLRDYWEQNCAAAVENLLVAARALGLGTVWLGVHPREERVAGMRELFRLPDEIMPFCVVAVGYPAEDPGPADRYQPSRVHYDRW